MRLKRGDIVEVMNRKEVPVSWRIAEILSGNGHTYQVIYDCYPGIESEQTVEKISRKFIRPFPPFVQGVDCFAAGDTVEVFYDYSWKTATILKVLEGESQFEYLVMLIGCSQQLIVGRSSIRMRLTLHDDKWIIVDKSSLGGDDLANKPSTSNCHQKIIIKISKFGGKAKKQRLKDCMEIHNGEFSKSRSLKRMSPPYSSSLVEEDERSKKFRRIEKDVYCNEMEISKQNVFGCSQVRRSKVSSSDSVATSVGSCSVNSQCPKNYSVFTSFLCQDTGTPCSDAESCSEEEASFASLKEEEVEISIHRLELDAYRSTLKAFYVSGPLSWEREASLTNLRQLLHISTDEHLTEGVKLEAHIIASRGLKIMPGCLGINFLDDTIRGPIIYYALVSDSSNLYDCLLHVFSGDINMPFAGLVPGHADIPVAQCYSRLMSDLGLVSKCQPLTQCKPSPLARDACLEKLKSRIQSFTEKKRRTGKRAPSLTPHSPSKKQHQEGMQAPLLATHVLDPATHECVLVVRAATDVSRDVPTGKITCRCVSARIKGLAGLNAAKLLEPPKPVAKSKRVPTSVLKKPADGSAASSQTSPGVAKKARVHFATRPVTGAASATMANGKRGKEALTVVLTKPITGEATLVPELSPIKTRVSARNKSLGSLPLPTCRKRKQTSLLLLLSVRKQVPLKT